MTSLRVVLGDQLSHGLSALEGLAPGHDVVLMMEVGEETRYVPHHKQKIVLILAAMRHFAAGLAARGVAVDYVRLDDPANTGSFTGELARAIARHRPARVIATEPGEWRVAEMMAGWPDRLGVPVEIREDTRFFASRARFARWAEGRRSYRMEYFYRELRRETGLLMDGGEPAGGRWNFDTENRKRLPRDLAPPARLRFPPDAVTRDVIALVDRLYPDHFGASEPFGWPVTRAAALEALEHFITEGLARFGDYQDAMRSGAAFLFHSLLSPALNIGLLDPREVCAAAEQAWRTRRAPLNAVEGFIRQILGWREYVRGIYWLRMPDYARTNALDAHEALPGFYWTGDTDMACVADVVRRISRTAYAHHIERLMVTGNLALLWGVEPAEIEAWYLAVFADAFEWVELPNTHGMAIFADGGLLASKPYAASGAYIDRMSDFCSACRYDPKQRAGENACPVTTLYWDFLARHAGRLRSNPRMAIPLQALARLSAAERSAIAARAEALRRAGSDRIGPGRDRAAP